MGYISGWVSHLAIKPYTLINLARISRPSVLDTVSMVPVKVGSLTDISHETLVSFLVLQHNAQ